jgi:hypothetical protein
MHFDLVPHPASPPSGPEFKVWARVELSASFGGSATINIWFGVGAPLDRFVIPESYGPGRADELWRTTCFEAFLREAGGDAYREWNFAPSGDWAAYDFAGYREGMEKAATPSAPYIRLEDNLTWWGVGATIAVDADSRCELGLSAVLEQTDGAKSYWALAHAGEKPDFHDARCFVAKLP